MKLLIVFQLCMMALNCMALNVGSNTINVHAKLKQLSIATIAAATIFTHSSSVSAAYSGSRMGGSSFSSSRSSGSYSSSRSSGSYSSYSSPKYSTYIYPSYDPNNLSYSPERKELTESEKRFNIIVLAIVILYGLLAFTSIQFLNLTQNLKFSSVVTVQVALLSDWNDDESVMNKLRELYDDERYLNSEYESLRKSAMRDLLSDVSSLLLSMKSEWRSGNIDIKRFIGCTTDIVNNLEFSYDKVVQNEKAKFDKIVTPGSSLDPKFLKMLKLDKSKLISKSEPTTVVVTIVFVMQDSKPTNFWLIPSMFSKIRMKKLLEEVKTLESSTYQYDYLFGLEVLWTPSEVGLILSEQEILDDYPKLKGF